MLDCAGAGPVQAGQDSRDVQQAAPGICAPYLKTVCHEIVRAQFSSGI